MRLVSICQKIEQHPIASAMLLITEADLQSRMTLERRRDVQQGNEALPISADGGSSNYEVLVTRCLV
jgi:hypothetical protein